MGGIEAAPSLHILSSRWERASDIFSLWSPLRNLWNSQLYCLVLFTIRVLWTEPRVQDRCVQSFNLICELVDPLCITKGNVAVWVHPQPLKLTPFPHASFGTAQSKAELTHCPATGPGELGKVMFPYRSGRTYGGQFRLLVRELPFKNQLL